ncbi:MAG: hypothetical protein JST25_12960 [Actinobacteria bacterium]|nr:hypothetical protein [Actinomycetota bacterium]
MRQAIARFRRRSLGGFPAPDVVLAGVLCLVAVASAITGNPAEGPIALTVPVAVVTTLALLWRRRSAVLTVALIAAASLVQTLIAQPPGSLWSLAVYAIAMYSLAAWCTEGVAAVAGSVFVGALLVEERIADGIDYVFILLVFGGVWLLGRASRHWRGRVTAAEHRQQEAARLAAAEERLRIARDLHDVVAHSLGAIAVQADAAEAALAVAPARAVEPVQAIRDTSRAALTDIRRVLDILREGDDGRGASLGATAVTALVESARVAGTRVTLDLRLIRTAPIPPAVDLASYRIVQESLTNARKHASHAAIDVTIVQSADELSIVVRNEAGSVIEPMVASSGYGIRGMAERVRDLGGSFTAGAAPQGGFTVRAVLPLVPGMGGTA